MMFLMPFNCTVEKDEIKAKRIAAPCSKQRAPRICQPTTTRELITNSASHTPSPAEVGPTCQPQEALFFFLSSLAFFPFSIGGTKARAITSQHGKQKNTHKFTGNSLYRGKVNFGGVGGGGNADAPRNPPPPPRTEFGPELGAEEGGGGGKIGAVRRQWSVRGGGGRIGGFLERRGEGERIPRDSLLSSPLLVSSSLPRVGVGVCGPLLLGACASLSTWAYYAIE